MPLLLMVCLSLTRLQHLQCVCAFCFIFVSNPTYTFCLSFCSKTFFFMSSSYLKKRMECMLEATQPAKLELLCFLGQQFTHLILICSLNFFSLLFAFHSLCCSSLLCSACCSIMRFFMSAVILRLSFLASLRGEVIFLFVISDTTRTHSATNKKVEILKFIFSKE